MNLEEFSIYQKNFEYLQKMIQDEGAELVLLPVRLKSSGTEHVAMCTQGSGGKNVFPHAILVWENPNDLLEPILLEGVPDAGDEPNKNG